MSFQAYHFPMPILPNPQNPVTEEFLRDGGALLRRASRFLGWAGFGEFIGHFVGLVVPDALVSDTTLGHIAAILLAGLGSLGVWARAAREHDDELRSQLAHVDLLFLRGMITDNERSRLREHCLRKLIRA
jgi:hypothetical protein